MRNFKNTLIMNGKYPSLKYSLAVFFTLIFFKGTQAASDTITIQGTVIDAVSKQPISAAQISVLNRNFNAVTDSVGNFSIKLASSSDLLIINAFDYVEKEVAVRGRHDLSIDMFSNQFRKNTNIKESANNNDLGVIVTNSYDKIDLNEPTTAITADELIQNELSGDVVRGIRRTATAGTGSALFIRGLNSINVNAQPLYVVDGVIWNSLYSAPSIYSGYYSSPLVDIDVNDIEDITVLKDGTSLYGSKGANGVILINTKRGKNMTTTIDVNAYFGWNSKPKSTPMMKASEYKTYLSEVLGTVDGLSASTIEKMPWFDEDQSRNYYNKYNNSTDWEKEVYRTGITQNYFVNVNGGDEKALYYFSLGYTGNDGVIKGTNMNRINTRFNADINMSKFLNLGLNIGFTNVTRDMMKDGVDNIASVTYLSKIKAPFLSPYAYTNSGNITKEYDDADEIGNLPNSDFTGVGNPSAIIANSYNYVKQYRFNVGAHPEVKINENWKVETMFDYSLNKTKEDFKAPKKGIADYTLYSENGTALITVEDYLESQTMRDIQIFDDTRLTYSNKFKNNNINAMLGWRYLNNYYESDYVKGHNGGENSAYISSSLLHPYIYGLNNRTVSISTYLNANYSFMNKYFLTGMVSMDSSSRFGKDAKEGAKMFGVRWGFFPSISGAWLASSETFLKDVEWLDMLKVRAGYSVTGNDDIVDYAAMSYFTSVQFLDRANGLVLSNLENSKLQWETTNRATVGIDLSVLKDRLSVNFDLYKSKTKNLLTLKTLPEYVGTATYWCNEGELENKGFELSASARVLNLRDYKIELGGGIGKYKNKVTKLPNGSFITDIYGAEVLTSVGNAAGVFYGYKTNGVFSTSAEAQAANLGYLNKDGSVTRFGAGDMRFADSGDGKQAMDANGNLVTIIDENDKVVIGDPNPDFYGNFYGNFTWKGLTLSALFTFSHGNDVYNYLRHNLESGSEVYNQTSAMLNRWRVEGQQTDMPRASYGDAAGNSRFSDRWIEDGSYLKLKTIKLSYELPVKPKFISGLTVWGSCDNVYTWTKYLGPDPEFAISNAVLYQGIDAGYLPLTRSFYFGVKINL